MEDTDWRPSPCPGCSAIRKARKNPYCENINCFYYKNVQSHNQADKERTMMSTKEPKQYVWIRPHGVAEVITDPVEVWQRPNFDREKDRIYELGNEVEVSITVAVKNKTVYRDTRLRDRNGQPTRLTPFEDRD